MTDEKRTSLEDRIEETLLKERRIFFAKQVDMDTTSDAIRKIWYLEAIDPGKPILLIINSPGGSIDAGFALWDQIQMVTSPVTTLVTGLAASMGSILSLASGKGKRFATPNSRIMIHQPRINGVIEGQATDLEIQAQEILNTRDQLIDIYVEATGQSKETIAQALDRDKWLTPEEAVEFGLLDGIVSSYKDLKL